MLALRTAVEVEVVGAVELVKAVQDVLACVGVDYVEKDSQTHAMGGVDELLQFFRRAVSGACSKETSDLVSEGWELSDSKMCDKMIRSYRHNKHVP